jgi:23S rRNA (guanosine2251-2'-O)-methyltransferase
MPTPRRPQRRRGERSPGEERLYGINPVEAALQAGRRRLQALALKSGPPSGPLARLHRLAQSRGVPVSAIAASELEVLSGSPSHQGAVLRCGPLPVEAEAAALALPPRLAEGRWPLLLALDQVEDPRNFGAVVRCAAAFGAQGVVVPRHHRAPYSPAASKASAGALETFPVFEVPNLARYLAQAKKQGFWVAGTVVAGGDPLDAFRLEQPLILVLGNEGRGLHDLIARSCDYRLTIPLPGGGSLNVAAAAAVLLYHLRGGGTTLPQG